MIMEAAILYSSGKLSMDLYAAINNIIKMFSI